MGILEKNCFVIESKETFYSRIEIIIF